MVFKGAFLEDNFDIGILDFVKEEKEKVFRT